MKVDSIEKWRLALKETFPVYLILSSQLEERKEALKLLKMPNKRPIYAESFDPKLFVQEIDQHSFFETEKSFLISNIENFDSKSLEVFIPFIEHPRKSTVLVFIGSHLTITSRLFKAIEKKGLCLKFKEKKKWERQHQLTQLLCAKAKEQGAILSSHVADQWVKSMEGHEDELFLELEKILCFLGFKGEITVDTLKEVGTFQKESPLWLLSDAIFQNERHKATKLLSDLMVDSSAHFSLLGFLRSQFEQALSLLSAYRQGGKEAAAQAAPQFRGAFLEKKVRNFLDYGESRLKRGFKMIVETEVEAKTVSLDPKIQMEILITRLTV